ncbi:DUF5995 family protein [Streptomyces sp. NBC_00513]|uniref:DUF5995 family protein n=1 Tax=unclassified Streptomyces TaxID=2593676 RepID=UPI00224D008F|nr:MULTISPECIES: DUF5995 family protein [unclassified Streptomyces]MCX5076521.1 DUF5995 family protein [Streptomyces sp. NBC_00424]MCX5156561.1 DUF5995 family protein [Streptomyces sp. NBC_00291]WUD40449.1 DUF5995 family protein [Streptomyces sp. NBC_00513]
MEAVLARMRALDERLPAQDGVAVFNRVYLTVTQTLHERLARGAFPAPRRAQALSVCFAERYLAAVEAERAPACWRPLLQYRRHPGIRPLQHALAGINAHIGHDLALAVVATCRHLGCEPAALEGDFDRVGDTLVSLEEQIREDLMPGPDLLEIADPLTHLVGSWSLERARAGAWSAARLLWTLRRVPELAEEFTDSLDAGVGLVGRCLLTPRG